MKNHLNSSYMMYFTKNFRLSIDCMKKVPSHEKKVPSQCITST
uniref:Uncharacterized protein n=1 Tax=Arundo donax TaxID=35708 RepID=A0A0A8YAE2_ARUDO